MWNRRGKAAVVLKWKGREGRKACDLLLKSGWNRGIKAGVSFQKESESTKGQNFRSRRDRQRKRGLHNSRRRAEERKGGV